jgi:hypothetical protein
VVIEGPEEEGEEVCSSVRIEEVGTSYMGYTPRRDTGEEREEWGSEEEGGGGKGETGRRGP